MIEIEDRKCRIDRKLAELLGHNYTVSGKQGDGENKVEVDDFRCPT